MLLDAGGALLTALATDEVCELETAQAQTGEGPCIECVVMGRAGPCARGDLRDDARWPRLATRLATSDVRAVLGVPTRIAGAPVGSLNVYRSEPYDWDGGDVAAVEAYNRIVEGVLVAAVAARRNERIVGQLQEALDRRVPIERSVGMLMGRHGLGAVAAFAALRGAAAPSAGGLRTSPRICSPAPRCRGFGISGGLARAARENRPSGVEDVGHSPPEETRCPTPPSHRRPRPRGRGCRLGSDR